MFSKPDPQSFTKFALSAGVFLLIAAFVVPGLVLRETGALRISRHELSSLTSLARHELERRQRIDRSAEVVAPYAGVILFVLGAGLLGYGVPRLKQKENADEERSLAELDKLRSEIQPQSPREREASLKEDAEQALAEKGVQSQADTAPRPVASITNVDRLMLRASEVDERVLVRLAEIAPPKYELRANVKISGGMLFDGLLVSRVDQSPDIVVEIKLIGNSFRNNLRNRISDAVARLVWYRTRMRRSAIGWLIFVAESPLGAEDHEFAKQRAAEYGMDLHVSIVTIDDLPGMSLP
jgi:hypothetical protein